MSKFEPVSRGDLGELRLSVLLVSGARRRSLVLRAEFTLLPRCGVPVAGPGAQLSPPLAITGIVVVAGQDVVSMPYRRHC